MTLNVEAVIASAANDVVRRFRGYTERDDLVQEGWMWTVLHRFKLGQYLDDEDRKRSEYRLRRDLTAAMERYARAQKAARLGYDIQDEFAYSVAVVTNLLPYAVRQEYTKPVDVQEGPSAKTDPAEGGNFTTMVLDVEAAWQMAPLDVTERNMVMLYVVHEWTETEIGEAYELSRQAVNSKIRKALRTLVNYLGGPEQKGCPYDCECHDARLRLRPGTHSEISGANQLAT